MKDLAKKVIYNFEDSDNDLIKSLSIENQIELIKEIVKILRAWKKEDCIESKFFLNENFRSLSDDAILIFIILFRNDIRKVILKEIDPLVWVWPCFITWSYGSLGQLVMKILKNDLSKNEMYFNDTLRKQFQEKYLKDFE